MLVHFVQLDTYTISLGSVLPDTCCCFLLFWTYWWQFAVYYSWFRWYRM